MRLLCEVQRISQERSGELHSIVVVETGYYVIPILQ
jgi:hypothetical protein